MKLEYWITDPTYAASKASITPLSRTCISLTSSSVPTAISSGLLTSRISLVLHAPPSTRMLAHRAVRAMYVRFIMRFPLEGDTEGRTQSTRLRRGGVVQHLEGGRRIPLHFGIP